MKALMAWIYKHNGTDNSNGGISSYADNILLASADGPLVVEGNEANLCRLEHVTIGGEKHYYVRPVAEPNNIGWMAGGTYVFSSDSRFPFPYPLPLHDRQETTDMADPKPR